MRKLKGLLKEYTGACEVLPEREVNVPPQTLSTQEEESVWSSRPVSVAHAMPTQSDGHCSAPVIVLCGIEEF